MYEDPVTGLAQACTLGAAAVCRAGYTCQANSATAGVFGYCCTGGGLSGAEGVCGSGSAQLTAAGQPVECGSFGGFCQSGYSCTLSANGNGRRYCCSPIASTCPPSPIPHHEDDAEWRVGFAAVCGANEVPLYQGTNRQLRTCTVTSTFFNNPFNGCPSNFACRQSSSGSHLSVHVSLPIGLRTR